MLPIPYRLLIDFPVISIKQQMIIIFYNHKLLYILTGGRGRGDGRRITLSSLVVSSMNALDYTVNPVTPQCQPRKKPKLNVSMQQPKHHCVRGAFLDLER